MKVVINRNDFSGIGTAVFYKKHKFFPSNVDIIPEEERDESNFTSDLVKYHGSRYNFPSINFAEYDFSYLVNKYKFDNRLLIADLDRTSQNLVGRYVNDTSKIGKVLFPTYIENVVEEDSINYFGSMEINNRNIFFFETPEDYDKIEIYEDVLDSNLGTGTNSFVEYDYLTLNGLYENTRITPSIVVYLGPEYTCLNNPTNMYYDNDEMKSVDVRRGENGERKSDVVYSRLIDEIMGKKIVYLLVSTNSTVIDFNVAFSAWNSDKNPHRNKWKYNIRNDEYYSTRYNVDIVEGDENGLFLDKKSDTILGNSAIDSSSCPIKTKKLNKLCPKTYSSTEIYNSGDEVSYLNQVWITYINNNIGNYPSETSSYWNLSNREYPGQYYSPYRKYMKGEITKYLKDPITDTYMIWESLVNDNIGNDPLLSGSWILSKKFLDFRTHIIYIITNPNNTGSSLIPNSQVTVNSLSNITFKINEGLGYKYSSVNLLGQYNNVINLEEGTDYTYTEVDTDDEYSKSVNISDWSEIIDEESEKYSNKVVFNFIESPSILNLKFCKDNTIYDLHEIQSLYNDGFNLNVRINGTNYPIPNDGKLVIQHPQNNQSIFMNYSGNLRLMELISKSRLGSTFSETEIPINTDNNSISSVVNFSEATYMFFLKVRSREIILISNSPVYNVQNQSIEVDYESPYNIDFTLLNNIEVDDNLLRRPRLTLFSFYREGNNVIRNDYSETFISPRYPQYNIEIPGPTETTIANFNLVNTENNSSVFRLSFNSVNNNIIVYFE